MDYEKNFIYDIYSIKKGNKIELNIFRINKNKELILEKKERNYKILIPKSDYESLDIKYNVVKNFKDLQKNEVVQIEFDSQEQYDKFYEFCKSEEIVTYERDLKPEINYLIDDETIEEVDFLPLKTAFIDIETLYHKNNKVILISLYSNELKKVWCLDENDEKLKEFENSQNQKKQDKKEYEIEFCKSEFDLVKKFQQTLIEENFNIITGWNVIDFDFKVIFDKFKEYNLDLYLNSFKFKSKLIINSDFFKESKLICPGTIVVDMINLLKKTDLTFADYKLDTVANSILELNKEIDFDGEDKAQEIENLYKNDIEKLIEYNYIDSKLVFQIDEKIKLLELNYKKSIITGNLFSKVGSPIISLDVMYLKKLHKKGVVAPTNFNFNESSKIQGAFVMTPEPNFYDNVLVFDFKSLYPSVMITFNIDPFTFSLTGEIDAPNGASFSKENGILANLLRKIYEQRNIAKGEGDLVKSYALKIIMNSFYGALGSPKCRFYNREIAEAITSFAQFFTKKTISYFEDEGLNVIYGDTDSIFINIGKTNDNLYELAENLEKDANSYIKKYIKEKYDLDSFLVLEFEKIYSKFFIASKKRYVGKIESKDVKKNNYIDFVGLEAVRGDWTDFAKNFQRDFIELVFDNKTEKELKKFIKDYVEKLKSGKFDNLLIYRKKITKPLSEYTKITPPHVKAAREVEDFKGQIVDYVMTKYGPKHISFLNSGTRIAFDYDHYVNKQLKAVVDDFLKYLNINFDDAVVGEKQNSLDKFF